MKTIRALRRLVCSFILLLFAQPIYAQGACEQWLGKLASAQGKVEIRRAGTSIWRPVRRGERYCDMDAIRTGRNSRAVLMLNTDPSNRTLTNLNQNTFLTFKSLGNEPTTFDLLIDLFKGGALFRSRQPNRLDIDTPFVNAVHKGTEFLVQVDPDQTLVTVYDGQVATSNAEGNLTIDKGETALAKRGKGPVKYAVVRPRDAVQWALNYPPVIDYQAASSTPYHPAIGDALSAYRRGDLLEALAILDQVPEAQRETDYYTTKAGLFLSVGRVDEATPAIEKALTLDSKNATAFALKSVIAVAQNQNDEATQLAERAAELEPESPTPQVALSYAHQAKFELEKALESAEKAVELGSGNALALSRLSELQLSMGYLDEALEAAEKATALDPDLARTQTVLGFAYLTKIDIDEARQTFEKAIELDQAAPLPHLGLGLAKIRKGEVKNGTDEIEIAASLDPDNSLIRSYLGKAFYEKKENLLAGTELEIAKELDPNDPTPWFYDAIRKQTTNRPVEALHDMQKAIALNDNRAVYRSRLLLDDDLAARSANLARIYDNLAFSNRARLEAWKSVAVSPHDNSAHRFLADSYAEVQRHEIARASELLQSQLLQPTNITPIPPQLAETDLAILEGAGPTVPSFTEFSPLFFRNSVAVQANAIVGSRDTLGDDFVVSGINGPFSGSLGQFHYQTNGFRTNADLTHNVYNAFGQLSITPKLHVQAELRQRDTDGGDVASTFFKENDPENRSTLEQNTVRVGGRYSLTPSNNLIFSLVYQDTESTFLNIIPFEAFPPDFPNPTEVRTKQSSRTDALQFEAQHLFRGNHFQTIAGFGYLNNDFRLNDRRETFDLSLGSVAIRNGVPESRVRVDDGEITNHFNGYFYVPLNFANNSIFTLGFSFDSFEEFGNRRNRVHPKFGLVWNPTSTTTFRAAAFSAQKRAFAANQTIEPTFLGGFNQLFDDTNGSDSKRYGLGIDQRVSDSIYAGVELSWRNVDFMKVREPGDRTFTLSDFQQFEHNQKESLHRAYVYWTPIDNLTLRTEYRYEQFDRESLGREVSGPDKLSTQSVPLSVQYFHRGGFFANVQTNFVHQQIEFDRFSGRVNRNGNNSFWITDASVGYRFPKRYGTVSLTVKNLLDEKFAFQDSFNPLELRSPQFAERLALFAGLNLWFH